MDRMTNTGMDVLMECNERIHEWVSGWWMNCVSKRMTGDMANKEDEWSFHDVDGWIHGLLHGWWKDRLMDEGTY